MPAPFHRRILPFIFAIVFIAVTPVVLFYTAGYRWNPKKGMVERNGTVILDSTPSGATINIDGRAYSSKSPTTIQDMAPGQHAFDFEKAGYHGWSKSLDVFPEKVTFANTVWLWKVATSSLLYQTNCTALSMSPDNSKLLLIQSATPAQAVVYDLVTDKAAPVNLNSTTTLSAHSIWSDNGRYVLNGPGAGDPAAWLIDTLGTHGPMLMTPAAYRWSGNDLIGNEGSDQTTLRTSDYGLGKLPFASSTQDSTETAEIRQAPGASGLVYVQLNNPERGLVLPPGDWRFYFSQSNHVLLRDGNNWLSLVAQSNPPEYHLAEGEAPHALSLKRQETYLLINGGELWTWNPLDDPELVLRQSDSIINAAWHRNGSDVFFATQRGIFALNLDDRDGRIVTQLETFDVVSDMTLNNGSLYILGTKNGKSGLWTLAVE